jgi:hypothetical protein
MPVPLSKLSFHHFHCFPVTFCPGDVIFGIVFARDVSTSSYLSYYSKSCTGLKIQCPVFPSSSSYLLPRALLYGCGAWSLTLSEEHRLRVFDNRVLRRIFRPKRDEVIGSWRKLHNEELHNLYCSPSIITMIK